MKTGPDALGTVENESGAQNMKTAPDALGTTQKESGRAKHENGTRLPRYRKTRKWYPMPSVQPKTSPGAQNLKTGHDALGNAENEP
jgi:hypothetical protein